jgi:hypothetical protein
MLIAHYCKQIGKTQVRSSGFKERRHVGKGSLFALLMISMGIYTRLKCPKPHHIGGKITIAAKFQPLLE